MKKLGGANILFVIAAAVMGGVFIGFAFGYNAGWFQGNHRPITNFEQCAAAGNPVMESYPRQCRANGQTFTEVVDTPIPVEPDGGIGDTPNGGCATAGCSGTICADIGEASDIVTTCEYREEYACYRTAKCERQATGKCGWTQTAALKNCLANPPALQ